MKRGTGNAPHLHVHIIPRRKGDGLKGFFWPRQRYADEAEMERVGEAVSVTVQRLLGSNLS